MKSRTVRIILPLALLYAAILLMMPRSVRFGYDYRQGSAWEHGTLVAQLPFPILKTADQILEERREKSNVAVPYYRYDSEVAVSAARQLLGLLPETNESLASAAAEGMSIVFGRGIVPDSGIKDSDGQIPDVIYVQKDKRAAKYPSSEVLKASEARQLFLRLTLGAGTEPYLDSLYRSRGIYDLIVPNLEYDARMTELVAGEKDSDVSPTIGFVQAGEVIVSEGEIVTPEIAQMLDSYKKEYESNVGSGTSALLHWAGNALIALAFVFLLMMTLHFSNPSLTSRWNEFLYVLLVVLMSSATALLVPKLGPEFLFLVPFTLFALFLQAFLDRRTAFAVYPVTLLPLLVFAENGIPLFVMFSVAGSFAIFSFRTFARRWKQFLLAFLTAAILAVLFIAFKFLHLVSGNMGQTLLMLFIGSMLTVAGYPLTFLFERIFNLISDARLEELCVTSNKVILELEQKAPGTFQHSLQVMNMSDAAARSIGANPLLVRAGALYHDIGKMLNPQCFIENESLMAEEDKGRYHSGLTPMQSSRDITRHVTDGAELADKYGLPSVLKDFILTHHGTTVTSFFYDKYLKEGGDPSDKDQFRYKGLKPFTREQLILMVADSIEAASRTLKDYSQESLNALVEDIVSRKVDEGQLDEAPVTMKELGMLKEAFCGYLGQMFHERIAYPDRKTNNK